MQESRLGPINFILMGAGVVLILSAPRVALFEKEVVLRTYPNYHRRASNLSKSMRVIRIGSKCAGV